MKVKIVKESLKGGKKSLLLSVYLGKGKYQQKSLKLYLKPEITAMDKEYNKKIFHEAEILRNEVELELLNKKLGKEDPKKKYDNSFLKYIKTIVDARYESGINYNAWRGIWKHVQSFTKGELDFNEVNELWLENFKAYFLRKVSQNSASTYFDKIRYAIHQAHRDGIFEIDYADIVTGIKQVSTHREYLTLSEVEILRDSYCRIPELKKAFLFSCLTGLRWSDMLALRWKNIIEEDGVWFILYKQKKTKNTEKLPITTDVLQIIGERGVVDRKVFTGLTYSAHLNSILLEWVQISGIRKHISFHCARHSYATLLLNNGVDIYTVSKLLGHSDIRTTEIYAKLLPEKKVQAVRMMPSLYND